MRNFKLILEYDGTDYHGWQVQPGLPTVQGALEEKLRIITGEAIRVIGAGRTDAGVHALGQVANFKSDLAIPSEKLARGLNSLPPYDIVVTHVEEVPLGFDARRLAKAKTYRYSFFYRPYPPALGARYTLYVPISLDIGAMTEAASFLLGRHDFSAFRSIHCGARSPCRTIYQARFSREGNYLYFYITADAFLQHMARSIIGTLLQVGKRKISSEGFREVLESKDRSKAGPTAPPHGLCLMEVHY